MVTAMITGKVIGQNQEGVTVATQKVTGVIAAGDMFGYPVAGEIHIDNFKSFKPAQILCRLFF